MIIRWDHPPHQPKNWITDVAGVGRYHVKREGHRRFWRVSLDGRPTVFTGKTADEVKAMVERAIHAYEMHRSKRS
jgi:hypothetical protein